MTAPSGAPRSVGRRLLSALFTLLASVLFPRRPFSIREKRLWGLRILLYLDQRTCQRIYLGVFEKPETKYFQRQIRPEDVCLDVGANVGYYSFLFSRQAYKVFAIEPIAQNVALIRLTAALNGLGNIDVLSGVAGSVSGSLTFEQRSQTGYSSVASTPASGLPAAFTARGQVSTYEVPAMTIDSLGLSKLDIVKIDVEGFEEACLKGMEKTLVALRPRLLMVELVSEHLDRFGSSLGSVIDLLRQIDYSPRVLTNGVLTPYIGQPVPNDNFFFVPLSKKTILE